MKLVIKIGIKIVFLCVFCFLFEGTLSAQVFPASATVRILPPYNTFIRELAQAGNERLQVILLQRDLATPSYQVRLKFKVFLDGNLLFETKPSYIPPIITIEGGIPTLLSGADLSSYFDAQNLNFAGMSLQTYLSSGNVPEGAYQFCATVFDAFVPTKVLSNAACQSFFMIRAEPPLLNMPACGTAILPNQLLTFRWNNVSSGGNWEYKLELFEIRNADGNPNNTVLSSSPVFTTTTTLNNYAYTPADPALLPNMRYAWRVQAVDLNGINQVRNNGNSLVCDFTNQPQTASGAPIAVIAVPLGIQAEAKSPSSGKVFWTPYAITTATPLSDKPDSYHVEYKKLAPASGSGFEWFKSSTLLENQVIMNDLEPSTAYQARMQSKKGTFFSEYSAIVNFTTPAAEVIVCGTKPIALLGSSVPYFGAMSGDKIKIDGFELVLDSLAEGEGGYYGGDGLMAVEFLGGKQFEVYFEGLFINELKEGGEGKVWFKMRDMTAWVQGMTGTDATAQAAAAAQEAAQALYADNDLDPNVLVYPKHTITGVSVNAQGQVILATSTGPVTVQLSDLPPPPRILPVVIEGKDGQQWVVNPDGTVATIPKGGLPPKYAYSDDKLEANDSLQVIFTEVGAQMYGYDTKKHFKWSKNYEIILLKNNRNYFVPYQSVATNATNGTIIVNVKFINREAKKEVAATATTPLIPAVPAFNYDISKVTFKLENGTNILTAVAFATPTSGFHTSYTVDIPAIDVGSRSIKETFIYAYYETKKIGKINISAFKKREEKVILVPVAGATLPSASAIQAYLNDIYKSANVVFTVETKGNFVFDLGTGANAGLERSDESMFGKYSLEMRALKSAYAAFDTAYNKKASYIFVVPSFSGTGDLKGFMVRGRSVGFVVPDADMRTYAHELGHGVFGLEHTFPEIPQTNIDNLMSYGTGTHLTHAQWKIMHARKPAYSWFDSEEDGSSMAGKCDFSIQTLVDADKIVDELLNPSGQGIYSQLNIFNDTQNTTNKNTLQIAILTYFSSKNKPYSLTNPSVELTCFTNLVYEIYEEIGYYKAFTNANIPTYPYYYREAIHINSTSIEEKANLIVARSLSVKKSKNAWLGMGGKLLNDIISLFKGNPYARLTKLGKFLVDIHPDNRPRGDIINHIVGNSALYADFRGNLTAFEKLQFIAEFQNAPIQAWTEFVNDPSLIGIWNNVDYLKEHRGSINFLVAIKKVKDDDVWKHIVGEAHSTTFANGGHYLGAANVVTDGAGVQWIIGQKIKFKVTDVQIPNPHTTISAIKKAKKIEIFNGTIWVPKTGGGISSFFPSTWDKQRIIEETGLAFSKAKADPNLYWDTISNGNTYYIWASDGQTKITLFYGANSDVNPLLTGLTTFPHIKSSFPKY